MTCVVNAAHQVDITRLENALKLQAEAMLASESSGLADGSSNGTAPGSPSGDGQQQQPVSPTAANNAGGNKRFDWGATLSPLLQGLASHPKAQQVGMDGHPPELVLEADVQARCGVRSLTSRQRA